MYDIIFVSALAKTSLIMDEFWYIFFIFPYFTRNFEGLVMVLFVADFVKSETFDDETC